MELNRQYRVIQIKQEIDSGQNFIDLTELTEEERAVKAEPEDVYCMEFSGNQNYFNRTGYNEASQGSSLKIAAVTQQYYDIFDEKCNKIDSRDYIVHKKKKVPDAVKKSRTKAIASTDLNPISTKKAKNSIKPQIKLEKSVTQSVLKQEQQDNQVISLSSSSQQNLIKDEQQSQDPVNYKSEPIGNELIKQEALVAYNPSFLLQYQEFEQPIMPKKNKKKRRVIVRLCDICGKECRSKYSIIWHMKEHMQTMPYNCETCGKGFTYSRCYKQHQLSHAEKVACHICNKKLKPHALYYHVNFKHSNEKPLKCPLCPKHFKTKDNITKHLMRHNQEFVCHLCERRFAEKARLQMHLEMHENPDAFFCKICNQTFEHIERHTKRVHTNVRERNLKCKYCEYASDSSQTLRRHENMHEKRKELMELKKIKKKKVRLIKLPTFKCEVCDVILQTRCGYKSHLRHYHKNDESAESFVKKLPPKEKEKARKRQPREKKQPLEKKQPEAIEDLQPEAVEIKIEQEEISVIQ